MHIFFNCKFNLHAPEIFPSTGFNFSKIASVRSLSLLQIQSTSPYPASIPSPFLYPNGDTVSSTTTSNAPPVINIFLLNFLFCISFKI